MASSIERYYSEFFPADYICRWLSYGNNPHSPDPYSDPTFLSRREFSFALPGDIYVRYKQFREHPDLKRALSLEKPEKIDIGAVWKFPPSKTRISHDLGQNEPLERELVFDIDMTDYDDVRTCCEGATLCEKCWKFLAIACECIHRVLKEGFGWSKLLWVFSGRRGIHCWVCDSEARRLNDEKRREIVDFMNSGERASHPPFGALYEEVLQERFEEVILEDENALVLNKHKNMLFQTVSKCETKEEMENAENSRDLWVNFCSAMKKTSKEFNGDLEIEAVVFKLLYPRIDVHVSTAMNHLLKTPFSVHPKTGKISVPFKIEDVYCFDVDRVANVESIFEGEFQIDQELELFQEFIEDCEEESARERAIIVEYRRMLEAQSGEF